MAYVGMNKMDAVGTNLSVRRNPVSVENERADAGRDFESVSREQIFRRERGTGKSSFSLFS